MKQRKKKTIKAYEEDHRRLKKEAVERDISIADLLELKLKK